MTPDEDPRSVNARSAGGCRPLAGVRALTIHRDLDLQRGGGVPRGILKRVAVLKELGADVEVWGLRGGERMAEQLEALGVPWKVVGVSGRTLAVGSARKLARMLAEHLPDVIQTHLYHASVQTAAAKLLGAPGKLIWTMHSPPPKFTRRMMLRLLMGAAHKIVFVSPVTAQQWRERVGVPEDKIFVLPNAVDTERFRPGIDVGDLAEELGLTDAEPVILCVARVDFRHKAQDKLLEIFQARIARDLPRAALVFVGGGPHLEELRQAARQSAVADRVRVLGVRYDVHRLMALADIFVLPSYYESDPNVIKEAAAAGLAIVCTATEGPRVYMRPGETAELVEIGDFAAMAERIVELGLDEQRRRRLAAAARRQAEEEFSLDKYRERVLELYRMVL